MGLEVYAFLLNAPELCQGKHLKAAAVSENRTVPVDEFVEPPHFPDYGVGGAKMQVVGIA